MRPEDTFEGRALIEEQAWLDSLPQPPTLRQLGFPPKEDRMGFQPLASLRSAPLGFTPAGISPAVPGGEVWLSRERRLSVIVSVDGGDLHASIAHPDRYPTWAEILSVRDWIFPAEMEVVMVLARRSEYVNLHPNCFHLWQSRCGQEGR